MVGATVYRFKVSVEDADKGDSVYAFSISVESDIIADDLYRSLLRDNLSIACKRALISMLKREGHDPELATSGYLDNACEQVFGPSGCGEGE